MLTEFEFALGFTRKEEGGTNLSVTDRGGATKYGISSKQYPDLDILNLTWEHAKQIYFKDYWIRNQCDRFSVEVGTTLFDSGVNCGVGSATRWLQMHCRSSGAVITVDGRVGPETIRIANLLDPHVLVGGIISYRIDRYVWLIQTYPDQIVNIAGWASRAAKLLRHTSFIPSFVNIPSL